MPKGEIKLEKVYIFAIVLIALIVATIVSLTLRHLKIKKRRTMSMPATVVKTRVKKKCKKSRKVIYYATFKLNNNEHKELQLPHHIMEKVEIGKKGIITFTSEHLIHFKEGEHPSHLFTHFTKRDRVK